MNLKKGLMITVGAVGVALAVAWDVIKLPFRLMGFLWRHKLATVLVGLAPWFGNGEMRAAQNRRADNIARARAMVESRNTPSPSRAVLPKSKNPPASGRTAPKASSQKNNIPVGSNDFRYDAATDAVLDKPLTDGMKSSVSEVSREKTEGNGKGPGTRLAQTTLTKTVEERLEKIITDGVMLPSFETMDTQIHLDRMRYKSERWGACTIAVCQATNVQNAAVVRVGYISRYDKGPGRFQIYRSDFVSDKGYAPIIEDINIALKGTNIRFGLHFDEKGVRQVPFVKGKPVFSVESQDGRELWVVRNGHLERQNDPEMINLVLAQFAANRPAEAFVQEYQESRVSVPRGREFGY